VEDRSLPSTFTAGSVSDLIADNNAPNQDNDVLGDLFDLTLTL
jgi:hypothetical protein